MTQITANVRRVEGGAVNETVTTALDALGLLLLAAGFGVEVYGWVLLIRDPAGFGAVAVGAGLVVAAVLVLVGSWVADKIRGPRVVAEVDR